MNVGVVGKRRIRRAGGRQFALMLGLALLVAACRQAPPALDTATQTITPDGGVVALPGGDTATFAPGFFAAAEPFYRLDGRLFRHVVDAQRAAVQLANGGPAVAV